ncbi:MAG: hypothetical protein ACD_78C00342G0004 [uncultured bacterium (gcode 4)]|uniref:Uncharacterized protein n=1 Tax=uncultured bacterium (gcode 4) TaxID=1234023 RepID=K1YWH4_9BACT|nr:MAG: hypothetical protein ACD_78C00342G0004 [uncultured bacterium (gcode 4)]
MRENTLEIIQMRTDIRMSGDNIAFPVFSQILQHAGFYIFKIDFRNILKRKRIFFLQKFFDRMDVLLYEINAFFSIEIIVFCSFDEKRIPKIQSIASTGSFSDLFEETVAIFQSQTVLSSYFCKFRICKEYRFIEKISSQTRSEIEDIHLHRSKKNRSKWHEFYMAGPCNDSFLGEKVHLSFPFRMTDSSAIGKSIFGEFSG